MSIWFYCFYARWKGHGCLIKKLQISLTLMVRRPAYKNPVNCASYDLVYLQKEGINKKRKNAELGQKRKEKNSKNNLWPWFSFLGTESSVQRKDAEEHIFQLLSVFLLTCQCLRGSSIGNKILSPGSFDSELSWLVAHESGKSPILPGFQTAQRWDYT